MAKLRNTFVNNNLNVTGLEVDGKIGNDDILRPIITITGSVTSRVIEVNMSQFISNSDTLNGRPKLHWWIASTNWNIPIVMTGNKTFVLNNGLSLDPTTAPTNAAILRTSLTDSNHIFKITINTTAIGAPVTYYFICSVQGIAYSGAFSLNTFGL